MSLPEEIGLSEEIELKAPGAPIVHETLDGEAVIINLQSGTYYSLQGIGAVLWQDIVAGTTPRGLRDRLVRELSVTAAVAVAAIDAFLADLAAEGLVAADRPLSPMSAEPGTVSAELAPALALQRYTDVQELLALDPVHDVDEVGWPVKPAATRLESEA